MTTRQTIEPLGEQTGTRYVGKRIPRVDGERLVTGAAKYASDSFLPGMLHAKLLYSKLPHARITSIDTSEALKVPGVAAVLTPQDIPSNLIGMTIWDRPVLAGSKVRSLADPVAAVAAEDELTAEKALGLIEIKYEELPAVFDIVEALKPDAPLVHEDKAAYRYAPFVTPPPDLEKNNISTHFKLYRGNVEQGFREADCVIEDRFTTHHVEQMPLEPHAAIASTDATGKVTVWCSTGKPFRTQSQLAAVLALPLSRVRVVQTHTGGEFGGKGEITVEPICAILAAKTGRPVKAVYTREEEFTSSTVRIPFKVQGKIGATGDGRLLALQMEMYLDIGPYNGMGGMVARWVSIIGAGPYVIPNVKLDVYCVYTNNPPGGAYRGFGNAQATFAREVLVDRVGEAIGMNPTEIRLKSSWSAGSTTATGQVLDPAKHGVGIKQTIERVKEITASFNQSPRVPASQSRRKGHGIASTVHASGAAFMFGADSSGCIVKLHPDGTVALLTGATDVGQGSDTVLTQIVAEQLGVNIEDISLAAKDTDGSPFDGGSSASRVLYFAGNAAFRAAADARRQLFEVVADRLEANGQDLEARDRKIFVRGSPDRFVSIADAAKMAYNVKGMPIVGSGYFAHTDAQVDENGQGNPVASFMYATHAAEVEVDTETGQVSVVRLVAAHDVGKAINPLVVEGQVEGGLANGLGYVLMENILVDRGRVLNPSLVDYKVPTAEDVRGLQVELVECPEPTGVYHAKGVGEICHVPTAAAIANAVYDAVGIRINDLPITPEKVFLEIRRKGLRGEAK